MKRGFTLIELLVVVLIIGILSAVALPQYNKAVEKSRSAQPLSIIKSVLGAQQRYYLANGNYTVNLEDLDISMPWTGTAKWKNGISSVSDGDWSLQINDACDAVYVGRLTGPYKGVGFGAAYSTKCFPQTDKIYCMERKADGITYAGAAGDYCTKVMGISSVSWSDGNVRAYLFE